MKLALDVIPKKIDECFLQEDNRENGVTFVVSKKHPEIRELKMNITSKYIFDRCDGINTVGDILIHINSDFKNVLPEKVNEDVYQILFLFWKLGFVEYDFNPYEYFYKKKTDTFAYEILVEDKISSEIDKISRYSVFEHDIKYDRNYDLNDKRIRQSVFMNMEQYSAVYVEDTALCIISIKIFVDERTTQDLTIHYLDEGLFDIGFSLADFIKWSQKKYAGLIQKKFYRLNAHLKSDSKYNKYLEKSGFVDNGTFINNMMYNGETASTVVKNLILYST